MVMVALRARELGFASTVNSMSLELVPPAGMPVIQEGTPLLVQGQSPGVLTLSLLDSRLADAL